MGEHYPSDSGLAEGRLRTPINVLVRVTTVNSSDLRSCPRVLGRFTKFLFIPAVREAADDASKGGTPFYFAHRFGCPSILAQKQELQQLKKTTQEQYEKILDPANLIELEVLEKRITGTLKTYVPNRDVEMEWLPLTELDLHFPGQREARRRCYASPVSLLATGLSARVSCLTICQHLALAQKRTNRSRNHCREHPTNPHCGDIATTPTTETPSQASAEEKLPSLVLAIEDLSYSNIQ